MKIRSILVVSLLMLITGVFLSYMLAQEENGTIINQPIFADRPRTFTLLFSFLIAVINPSKFLRLRLE